MKTTSILILILVLVGCSNKQDTITIYPLVNDVQNFSIDVIKSIELTNQSDVIIGAVDKLLLSQEHIYLLDKRKLSSLMVFDTEGKLINKIHRGRGPGELVDIEDFDILNERLVVSDQFQIKYYSLKGDYISKINLPEGWFIWHFLVADKNQILIHGSASIENSVHPTEFSKYHLVNDSFTRSFESYCKIDKEFLTYLEHQPVCLYDGKVLLSGRPLGYIYELSETDLKKKYFVDFGHFNYTKADINKGINSVGQLYRNGERYGLLDNIIENKDILHFVYGAWSMGKGQAVSIIYSKKYKKAARLQEVLKKNGLPPISVFHAFEKNLVCCIEPSNLSQDEISDLNNTSVLKSKITSESNPIVLILQINAIR